MPEIYEILLSFLTLTVLEIVLGIDNLIFLAIISHKLPKEQQKSARRIGLLLAWVLRLIFLATAIWIAKLVKPLFTVFAMSFSGRDLFLLIGGLFLIFKATQEIHIALEPIEMAKSDKGSPASKHNTKEKITRRYPSFTWIVFQITLLDIVFSLDSILTAIGLTQRFWLMSLAITIAILTMVFASEPLSNFVEKHPSIKMLALSFLLLIGMVLIADSFKFHIPRGYIYFAMGFSFLVESLNLLQRKRKPIS